MIGAADAVKGTCGDADNLLVLQASDAPWTTDVVVCAMTQPVVVAFTPIQIKNIVGFINELKTFLCNHVYLKKK